MPLALIGTGKSDIWARLDGPNNSPRTFARWDGSQWSIDPAPSALNLSGIWPVSPTDVWGVGPVGTIMHFDGTSWSKQASGTVYDISDIWGFGPNDVWVADSAGHVFHYDGSQWSSKDLGLPIPFSGRVWGLSSSDYWLCGTGTLDGAYHWSSGVWTPLYTGGPVSECIGRSANDVMFLLSLGYGAREWTSSADAGAISVSLPVRSGQMSVDNYVLWATGGEYVVGSDPFWGGNALAHGTPASWTMYTHDSGGTIGSLLWDAGGGNLYSIVPSPGTSMPNTFAKYSTASGPPGQWTPGGPIGTDRTMHAIWGSSANDVWVVGDNGIATHYDGSTWTAQSIQSAALTDVWGSAPDDFWATGGASYHYDGQQWTASGPGWAPVSGSGENDVWLAGGNSASHWDGSNWTAFHLDLMIGGNNIARLNAFAANDAWLVTTLGDVFHWNGTTWLGSANAYCPQGTDGGVCGSPLISQSGNGAFGFVWNASGDGWVSMTSGPPQGFWHTTGKNFDPADILPFDPPGSAIGEFVSDYGGTIGVPGSVWSGTSTLHPLWKLQ